jgi:hypothetical protein
VEPSGEDLCAQRGVGDQRDTESAGGGQHAVALDAAVEQVDLHLVGRQFDALSAQGSESGAGLYPG